MIIRKAKFQTQNFERLKFFTAFRRLTSLGVIKLAQCVTRFLNLSGLVWCSPIGVYRYLAKLEGLLEASGVANWIFLVVLKICCLWSTTNTDKNNLEMFWGFMIFLYASLKVCKSVLYLSHQFAKMVKKLDSTLRLSVKFSMIWWRFLKS